MQLAEVSRMIDVSVWLELNPEAEYLASLMRPATRRLNRRLSMYIPNPPDRAIEKPRRITIDVRMPVAVSSTALIETTNQSTTQDSTISDPDSIDHDTTPNVQNSNSSEAIEMMLDEAMDSTESVQSMQPIDSEMCTSVAPVDCVDNNIEATSSKVPIQSTTQGLTPSDQDSIDYDPSLNEQDLNSSETIEMIDEAMNSTEPVQPMQAIDSEIGTSFASVDGSVSELAHSDAHDGWVTFDEVQNRENNTNLNNILGPFIPFKIRGRRPSKNYRTQLEPIFERPEPTNDQA